MQYHLQRLFGEFAGGGFALSDATAASGLSDWIGEQLSGLASLPPFVTMLIICIITALITEVASNTATANILLPILAKTVKEYITNLWEFLFHSTFHFCCC